MKDIDEAIQHCEDVAQQQDMLKGRYDDASGYTRSGNEAIRTSDAKKCEKCAAEHRQLAEWLKDYKQLLELQPCMDAISRQAVLDLLENTNNGWIINEVLQLPPVTPQPKMGCEGCIYEKTGTNSTYPCSHCRRCFVDKYKAERSGEE